jgi:hypothetical protein
MAITPTKEREPTGEKVTSTMFRSWWGTLKHSNLWCNKLNTLVIYNCPSHLHNKRRLCSWKTFYITLKQTNYQKFHATLEHTSYVTTLLCKINQCHCFFYILQLAQGGLYFQPKLVARLFFPLTWITSVWLISNIACAIFRITTAKLGIEIDH